MKNIKITETKISLREIRYELKSYNPYERFSSEYNKMAKNKINTDINIKSYLR